MYPQPNLDEDFTKRELVALTIGRVLSFFEKEYYDIYLEAIDIVSEFGEEYGDSKVRPGSWSEHLATGDRVLMWVTITNVKKAISLYSPVILNDEGISLLTSVPRLEPKEKINVEELSKIFLCGSSVFH